MFRYTLTDGDLLIKYNSGENSCCNNLNSFQNQSFSNVTIEGSLFSEFELSSNNLRINKLEVKNCFINLQKLTGRFNQITFSNCKFIGTLNQLQAVRIDFYCGIQLKQLIQGNIEQINVTVNTSQNDLAVGALTWTDFTNQNTVNVLDLTDIEHMKNLNQLTLISTGVDLSLLNGTWKQTIFHDCNLKKQISQTFHTEFIEIKSRNTEILSLFANYSFETVWFKFKLQQTVHPLNFNKIQWKNAKLLLEYCSVDIESLSGHFEEFKASNCKFMNNFPASLSCNKMILINCNTIESYQYSTNIIKKILCNSLEIENNAIIHCLPSVKELSLYNCKIILRNQLPNLFKMILNLCDIQCLVGSQVPALKELITSNNNKNIQVLRNSLKILQNAQKQIDKKIKSIEIKKKQRHKYQSQINKYQFQIQQCLLLTLDQFCQGVE
ncbi:Hypothetical_protein [Hexamita inflata]|uniref:Hypothetical_protein n=1 Tax=Hexamita inflata TaxID=28002 RepID=A0AA86QG86_9EUKA|nr:Hypothetical protein HINF_LOCUS40224 [Hexamita inflata]